MYVNYLDGRYCSEMLIQVVYERNTMVYREASVNECFMRELQNYEKFGIICGLDILEDCGWVDARILLDFAV